MKDFKYIIKRIIIGVAIAIILMLIKGSLVLNVNAQTINSKMSIANNSGTVIYTTPQMGANYPVVQNSKYILIYFGLDLTPSSKYNLCVQWSFSTQGQTRNRPSLDWLLLNGNSTSFTHTLNVLEETNYQSYYYHYYNDCITFSNANNSGPTQVQLTYSIPNVSTITQLSWHDKTFQYIGSTGQDTTSAINSATSNIINNNNINTQNIINNQNANTQQMLDDDTTSASTSIAGKLANFHFNTYGLTGIITAPLRFFESLLSATCTPLEFSLPFVHNNVVLPCMSAIYQQYFPTFLFLYRLITDGLIGYWVCIKIFQKVKGFLDPTDDKVEVFDL